MAAQIRHMRRPDIKTQNKMVKRKYRLFILIAIGSVLMAGIFLLFSQRERISKEIEKISEKIIDDFQLRKGTAKWFHTHSSDESKKKGVFVCYYDALPFEYKDSIFQMKLVFDEVYVEWVHWYKWPDTLQKKCLYYKNSETGNGHQLVGIYNEDSCILGFSHILKSNYNDYEEDECYVCYDDSLKYLKDFSSVFSQDKDRSPLFYWEAHAGQWPELWFDTYDVDRDIYGDDTPPFREFGDTIKIPIYFSRGYNKLCGYNEYAKLPLGELTFVKRKQ
ncbi:MAG: hypothetical protein IKO89_01715 [Bacteroidales bacterium]|nr:hypothetical protein [Bacteroidales bacterium]MBR4487260.1 hypothetical protein [Bacteroidales bacterium]